MMDTTTHIVLNDTNNHLFPLEAKIRLLADVPNTVVVCLFDCCRETIVKTAAKKVVKKNNQQTTTETAKPQAQTEAGNEEE